MPLLLPSVCVVFGCAVAVAVGVVVIVVDVVAAVARVSLPSGAAAPRRSRSRRCPGDSSSLADGSAAVVRSEAAEAVGVEHAAAGVAATETTAESWKSCQSG